MDGHVLEDATTALDILKRRWCRIAAAQFDLYQLTNLTSGDGIFDAPEIWVEPALQSSHQLHARLIAGVDSLNGLRQIGRNLWSSITHAVSQQHTREEE